MSVNQVLFISEEKLKSFCSQINQNVNPQDLLPSVINAQQIYLTNLIGSTFYKALELQVRTGTLSVANKYFLDEYVSPMLCNYSLMLALPWLKYKITNKSVLSPKSESADSIEMEELKFLIANTRNVAEQYGTLLQRFLQWHPTEYPLYNQSLLQDGLLPDRGPVYTAPLVTSHYGYAMGKRLASRLSRGQYGYGVQDDIGYTSYNGGENFCDFPYWLWNGSLI